nr:MAG TPA: hypothetical protein [Caudoviricetes sp.]
MELTAIFCKCRHFFYVILRPIPFCSRTKTVEMGSKTGC